MRARRANPLRLLSTTGKSSNLHFAPDQYLALLSPTTRHSILDPYLGNVSGGRRLDKDWRRPALHRDDGTATISPICNGDEVAAVAVAVPRAGNTRTQPELYCSLSCPHNLSTRRSSSQSTAVDSKLLTGCDLQGTNQGTDEIELSHHPSGNDTTRDRAIICTEYFDGGDRCVSDVPATEEIGDDLRHYLRRPPGPELRVRTDNVSLAASSGVLSPVLMPKIALHESVATRASSCTIPSVNTVYSVEAQEMTENRAGSHNVPNLRRVVEKAWIRTRHKHWKRL